MFKEPTQNKAMKGHVIRSEDVPNEGSCRVLCYMEPNCVSINVGPLQGGKHKCELNNATAENQFDAFLVNMDKFTYVASEVSLFMVKTRTASTTNKRLIFCRRANGFITEVNCYEKNVHYVLS